MGYSSKVSCDSWFHVSFMLWFYLQLHSCVHRWSSSSWTYQQFFDCICHFWINDLQYHVPCWNPSFWAVRSIHSCDLFLFLCGEIQIFGWLHHKPLFLNRGSLPVVNFTNYHPNQAKSLHSLQCWQAAAWSTPRRGLRFSPGPLLGTGPVTGEADATTRNVMILVVIGNV